MKKRNGFVSNSSSSSFILSKDIDTKILDEHGVKFYKVSFILDVLKPIKVASKVISSNYACALPERIVDIVRDIMEYIPLYEEMVQAEKVSPGCYITERVSDCSDTYDILEESVYWIESID